MKQTKVYDYAGVLADISGWKRFFETNHPTLYYQYILVGDSNISLKRKIRPKVIDIYENAVEQGLFKMPLFSEAKDRLREDQRSGYVTSLFTSSPREPLVHQLQENGLGNFIDEIVILDDIREEFQLQGLMKEDPAIFEALMKHLQTNLMLNVLLSYTDDTIGRVNSVVQANTNLAEQGIQGFQTIYHLDKKAPEAVVERKGYTTINSLFSIQ